MNIMKQSFRSPLRLLFFAFLSMSIFLSSFAVSEAAKIKPNPQLQVLIKGENSSVLQGTPNAILNTLDCYANAGPVTINSLTFRLNGTAEEIYDVCATRVWIDDGDGLFEPLHKISGATTDTVVQNIEFKPMSTGEAGYIKAKNLNINLNSNSHKLIYLTVDLTWTASIGTTRSSYITNGDIEVSSPATVMPIPTDGLFGPTITIEERTDNLKIVHTATSSDTIGLNTENNVVQILTLSLDGDSTTLKSITVTRTGDSTDTAVKEQGVKLWLDKDNSASVTPVDILLSNPQSFNNRKATFQNIDLDIYSKDYVRLLITYSISNNAPIDTTIGSQIAESSDIVVSESDTVKLARTPLGANLFTDYQGSTLMVSHEIPQDLQVKPGLIYQMLDVLNLSVIGQKDVEVYSINIKKQGDATAEDIIALKLIEDSNNNLTYDSEDRILDITILNNDNLVFQLPSGWKASAGSTKTLFVCADYAPNANPNHCIKITLDKETSFEISVFDDVDILGYAPTSLLGDNTSTNTDLPVSDDTAPKNNIDQAIQTSSENFSSSSETVTTIQE